MIVAVKNKMFSAKFYIIGLHFFDILKKVNYGNSTLIGTFKVMLIKLLNNLNDVGPRFT